MLEIMWRLYYEFMSNCELRNQFQLCLFLGRKDSSGVNVFKCMEVNSQEMELGWWLCGDPRPY
jgi:hypothetical protein